MTEAIGWSIIILIIIVPLYLVCKKLFGKDDSKQLDSIRKKTTSEEVVIFAMKMKQQTITLQT